MLALGAIAAAVAAVVLIVALSGGDDEKTTVATAPPPTGTTDTRDGSRDQPAGQRDRRSRKREGNSSAPVREREAPRSIRQRTPGTRVQRIVVRDGVPVDGLVRLIYDRGQRVRLVVSSNRSNVVKISGFDQEQRVAAGRDARFDFRATEGGLYGVELDRGSTRIAVLAIR